MTNITQKVWNIILKEPAIRKNLKNDLINVRALAKYLIKRYKLNVSLDGVITAIRRYLQEEDFQEEEEEFVDIFAGSNVSTKNNIACITIRKSVNIFDNLSRLFTINDFSRKETFRLIMGRDSIKVMVDKENLKKVKSVFPEKSIVGVEDNLSELSLFIGLKAKQTKGVMAKIASEIAVHDVNIVEIINCIPEILIYVKKEDLLKAHESLIKLIS